MKDNNDTRAIGNKDHIKSGRYLYADYTQFEEDKNFLEMLRNFVIVSRDVTGLQDEIKELQLVLGNAQALHSEMTSKITQFRSSVHDTMDSFHKEYNEMTYSLRTAAANNLFIETKDSLVKLLTATEQKFNQQPEDFNKYAETRIKECNKNASGRLESWLLNWRYMMPYALASKISNTATVSIDNQDGDSTYKVSCENALIIGSSDSSSLAAAPPSLSYSFSIDTADLEFWNYRKRISDLGMQNVLLPVGLRIPVSTRLKKSFKLGLGDDNDQLAEKEPEFVDIGGYYVVFAKMEGNKTLFVRLAAEPSNPRDQIEMQFNLSAIYGPGQAGKTFGEGGTPRINYLAADSSQSCSDLLQIKEIAQHADMQKILLVGRTLADKMKILLDADVVASRGQLSSVATNGKNMIAITDSSLYYDAPAVILSLELLAGSFKPIVQKLRDKSPVAGELILKQQLEGGDRKEYVVRTEELESMLLSSENGKRILHALGLSADAVMSKTAMTS